MDEVSVTVNVLSEQKCFFCKTGTPVYLTSPCRCILTCKKCAMKMATGGKCKLCKEYFTGFVSII